MLHRRLDIKLQIAICVFLAVGAYVLVNVELPPWSHVISAFSVVAFAIPTMLVLRLWLGTRDGLALFGILAGVALLIETLAIITGFPYGHFDYSGHLGFKLFGVVPWTVAFAWPPLMLGAYSAAANLTARVAWRLLIATLLMVAFDLVLDPGAVYLGFWRYADAGWFYGVPVSNFAGWMVTSLIGASIMEITVRRFQPLLPVPVQILTAPVFILFFWSAIAVFANLHLAFFVAMGVQTFLSVLQVTRGYNFDEMIVLVDDRDHPLGTAPKIPTHDVDTPLHRAFSVFIFNSKGELLLQQRALSKKTWPGVWSNSCCGHVMLHETTENAAARRLRFELGLQGIDLLTALPDFRYRAEKDGVVENEICPVLVGKTDKRPDPNPREVADTRWIPWDAFLASLDEPGNEISPWAVEEVRLLAGSDLFRRWFAGNVPASGIGGAMC